MIQRAAEVGLSRAVGIPLGMFSAMSAQLSGGARVLFRGVLKHRLPLFVSLTLVHWVLAFVFLSPPVCACPSRTQRTRNDAAAIQSAVTMYVAVNPGKPCPSIDHLIGERILDSSRPVKDAWERDFTIECEGGDVIVSSAGPDGQSGNDDDIRTSP